MKARNFVAKSMPKGKVEPNKKKEQNKQDARYWRQVKRGALFDFI